MTYALVSDGDVMEGVALEAASLAGHLGLGKLVYLYDSNSVTLDGPASLSFSVEDVRKRYEAYGWQVLTVKDGDHVSPGRILVCGPPSFSGATCIPCQCVVVISPS